MLGASYSTYAVVLWGYLPYIVKENTLGTAFGICTVFQNFGTTIAPPILGWIQEKTYQTKSGFFFIEVFFIIISLCALLCNYGSYLIKN